MSLTIYLAVLSARGMVSDTTKRNLVPQGPGPPSSREHCLVALGMPGWLRSHRAFAKPSLLILQLYLVHLQT